MVNMTYIFNVPEPREEIVLEENLIPRALEEAQRVKPCDEIRLMWEGQVFRDLEVNKPSNWIKFLTRLTNELWAAIP